jgi:hypothetical protein
MTEQELRALVRSVIAQHVGSPQHPDSGAPASSPLLPAPSPLLPAPSPLFAAPSPLFAAPSPLLPAPSLMRQHASHALFVIPAQGDACIIEPGVTCNHCGYCKSYGH